MMCHRSAWSARHPGRCGAMCVRECPSRRPGICVTNPPPQGRSIHMHKLVVTHEVCVVRSAGVARVSPPCHAPGPKPPVMMALWTLPSMALQASTSASDSA